MDSITAMNKLLSNLQAKFNHLNNLMNLTKEMGTILSFNDEFSLAAILDMREKVMLMVDKLDDENEQIVARLPSPVKERMQSVLFPDGSSVRLENPLETNIFDTNKRNLMLLQKIVSLDTQINGNVSKL